MERLTERDEFGNANIIGVESADLQLNLMYDDFNRVTDALNKLSDYKDAEEQGLLLRLGSKDDKDKLIEVLSTKLFQSEFGRCYMCTNSMKNITLDGVNNGCDGGCLTSEKFTVVDFIKKIVRELEYIKWKEAEQAFEEMKGDCNHCICRSVIDVVNQLAEEYNNDVCEWTEDMTLSRSAIGHGKFESLMYVSKWNYCPYCGKKIKVVD